MPEPTRSADAVSGPGDLVVRAMHLREVRKDAREAEFTFSTSTEDRYGEIVEQVWQLDNFALNPVALWSHSHSALPIGKAKDVGVVDGALRGTIVFATAKANPQAELVWQSILEGTLRAVSVGFVPHTTRWETENDRERLVLSDNELWEISVCTIPANPEALMRMRERAIAAATGEWLGPNHPKEVSVPDTDPAVEQVDDATPAPQSDNAPPEPIAADNAEPVADNAAGHAEADDANGAPAPAADEAPSPAEPEPAECAADLRKALDVECTKRELSEQHAKDLTDRLAESHERVKTLECELVEKRLAEMVGKQITASEKPGLLKLYRAAPEDFEAQLDAIKARPPLPMARTESVLGADPSTPPPTTNNEEIPGAALVAAVNRRLGR